MSTIIVSVSRSPHGNTARLAETLASELDARILTPAKATPGVLQQADCVGFGSGVYNMNLDRDLIQCAENLPDMRGRAAFVFLTSGMPEPPFRRYARGFGRLLESRGFRVVGTFTCRGVDTWGPFGIVGGVNKGRPDRDDLQAARQFAKGIAVG